MSDTILLEAEQTPSIPFAADEKIIIAKALDDLSIDMTQAGHQPVSKKIEEPIKKIIKSVSTDTRMVLKKKSNVKMRTLTEEMSLIYIQNKR